MRTTRLIRYAFLALCGPGALMLSAQNNAGTGKAEQKGDSIEIFTQNRPDPRQNIALVPVEFQHGFRLFQAKCAQCHQLDRTLRKSNLSQDEWGDIVYRMQDMASSHMNPAQSDAITKYLVWNDIFQQKTGRP
jgi:mono/diheme cytochrome c family protein